MASSRSQIARPDGLMDKLMLSWTTRQDLKKKAYKTFYFCSGTSPKSFIPSISLFFPVAYSVSLKAAWGLRPKGVLNTVTKISVEGFGYLLQRGNLRQLQILFFCLLKCAVTDPELSRQVAEFNRKRDICKFKSYLSVVNPIRTANWLHLSKNRMKINYHE